MQRLARWSSFGVALALCACDGLTESKFVCTEATPGFGQPCGECGVLRCAGGALACTTPQTPREDVVVQIPPKLLALISDADLEATVRSDLPGAPERPISLTQRQVKGCLPGLSESAQVELTVSLSIEDVEIAQLSSGPRSAQPGVLLEVAEPTLTLPDEDGDGAQNIYEVLVDPALVAEPTAVPPTFSDRLVDIYSPTDQRVFTHFTPLFSGPDLLLFSRQLSLKGQDFGPQASWVNPVTHVVRSRVDLPCLVTSAAYNPELLNVVAVCDGNDGVVFSVAPDNDLTLSIQGELSLPRGFVARSIAQPLAFESSYVMGRYEGEAALLEYETRGIPRLSQVRTVEGVIELQDMVAVPGGLIVSAPVDSALLWLEMDGDSLTVRARLELPGSPTSMVLATPDELWVGLSQPSGVVVVPLADQAFKEVELIPTDRSIHSVSVGGVASPWVYASANKTIYRFGRALRALEGTYRLQGAGDPAEFLSIQMTDETVFASLGKYQGVGVFSFSTKVTSADEPRGGAPLRLAEPLSRAIGQAGALDPGSLSSGHPQLVGDLVEDLFDIEVEAESLVLLRPSSSVISLVLTQFEDETPVRYFFKEAVFNGMLSAGHPHAVHVEAGLHRFGVSMPDDRTDSESAYLLDVFPMPQGRARIIEMEVPPDLMTAADLPVPSTLSGTVGQEEQDTITVFPRTGGQFPVHDLFRLGSTTRHAMIYLEYDAEADLDLYLLDANGEVVSASALIQTGHVVESILYLDEQGPYFVGVSAYQGQAIDYTLHVIPLRLDVP